MWALEEIAQLTPYGDGDGRPGTTRTWSQNMKHWTWNWTACLPVEVETPSMTNWSFVMISSQARHVSPAPAPPHTLGMLSCGKRRSLSFS